MQLETLLLASMNGLAHQVFYAQQAAHFKGHDVRMMHSVWCCTSWHVADTSRLVLLHPEWSIVHGSISCAQQDAPSSQAVRMLSQLCWAGKGDKIAGSQDAESAVLGRPKVAGLQPASMQRVRLVVCGGC